MPQRVMYEVEIRHDGLGAYRHIRGSDYHVVMQKAQAQQRAWEERWRKLHQKEETINKKLAKKEQAEARASAAILALKNIEDTLQRTLTRNDTVDWDALKDRSEFSTPEPPVPTPEPLPPEPYRAEPRYQPKLSLLDKLISSRREKRSAEAQMAFDKEHSKWQHKCKEIRNLNEAKLQTYQKELEHWKNDQALFASVQAAKNATIDRKRQEYLEQLPNAIVDYCDTVLANSEYPDPFPKSFEIDYIPGNRTLVVDYQLPALEALPTLKEVKYVASKDELVESHLSESALRKIYDDLLYKIMLRSLHELFEADVVGTLESIVFNGWVRSIDKGTGQETNPCILSVQALKKEFLQINLAQVDPKACFKRLKGVGSSKLSELAPIRPILELNKEDKRFVSAYDVADTLDDSLNLAAMDWLDFENLIREMFEKVFSRHGGEVKITQASRDGGVDAIAFDPDPIRGGKIVIQAKRYTNTVGVSAVRDLYGTVHNEGAIKGILVTTSDYGPDAYAFAKDKPLTLLSGSNLLHLLAEHGHKARIDLREAKEAQA